jgi:hypothetical protein
MLSEISDRLGNEDKSLLTLRDAYQSLAGENLIKYIVLVNDFDMSSNL